MNLDLDYNPIISRLLCKKWRFLGKVWQEHRCARRHNPGDVEQVQERPGYLGFMSPFHLPLHHFQGYNDVPVFWEQSSITQRGCHESPGPFLIRDYTSPFLSSTYVQGSAVLEKDRKTHPPCPSTGNSVREWNKSENIHYRIWIPTICSQLCSLLASHSVPLHLYFLVCSDMTWS